jgi:hypothetical protein
MTARRTVLSAVLPRPHQIARAEQLGAWVVSDDRLADEQAVQHQQSDRVRSARKRTRRRPRTTGHIDRAREQPLTDLADTPRVETTSEVGVCFEKLYGAVTGVWHYERIPRLGGAGAPAGRPAM